MSVNLELAKEKNLSEDSIENINFIHNALSYLIDNAENIDNPDSAFELFTEAEYTLQRLWGFSEDHLYHTWTRRLHKRYREIEYLGAVYRCNDSHETRTIDSHDLQSGVLVNVGSGFIDFGGVVRIVGPLERVA